MSPEVRENMPHADDGLLHAYLDGELTGAERDHFLAHQAECVTCRTRLEEERALAARAADLLARAAPAVRAPAGFAAVARSHAPRWRIPAAWAATVTIAFVMGWYVQGARLAREVAKQARPFEEERVRISPPEVRAPFSNDMKTPRRSIKVAPTPPPATGAAREDAPSQLTARAAPSAPVAAAASRELDAWPALDADAARTLLGRAPAVLPGRPIRRMARSPTDNTVVVIEQEWRPGIVLRLYERRAINAGQVDAAQPSAGRDRSAPGAKTALRGELRGENLARYVSSLRVEIAGPLSSDSLAQLLDSLE
jgi:putative zinc finger protein